jgi:hypothetical protein
MLHARMASGNSDLTRWYLACCTILQANCGACGSVCGPNSSCWAGNCVCTTDFGDCNNDLTDGCETPLLTTDVRAAAGTAYKAGWAWSHMLIWLLCFHMHAFNLFAGKLRRLWQSLSP